MGKGIKAKSDLGVNSIMDPVMIPDGFSRVCDGLDLRSGVARTWQLPVIHRDLRDPMTKCIWEFRNLWFESELFRSYHGELLYGQQIVYFTEEGAEHLPPQKVIDGTQARLGIQRPLAQPVVSNNGARYPAAITAVLSGAGSLNSAVVSYRIAASVGGKVLVPSSSVLVALPQVAGVVTPSRVTLTWRKVKGADGYVIFGRASGSERQMVVLGDTNTWTDDGSIGVGSQPATAYDVAHSYQYVYTYYRKVGSVEDESGPSPISNIITGNSTPIITRLPQYDGLYNQSGTVFYTMSTNNITATIPSKYVHNLSYSTVNSSDTITMYTSTVAHGMATGDLGQISINTLPSMVNSGVEYSATVPYDLQPPAVTFASFPVGGTVPVGLRVYSFTAVRGTSNADAVNNPAQTLPTIISVTVPGGGSQSVQFNIGSYTPGTDSILVYRDGSPVAFIPMSGALAVATWTDTGAAWPTSLTACTIPIQNETSIRCFSLIGNMPLPFGPPTGYPGVFQQSLCDIQLSGVETPPFVPTHLDALLFSGLTTLSALNGVALVRSYDTLTSKTTIQKFVDLTLDGSVDSSSGTMRWTPVNGNYAGWRLYRIGDTAEFLKVADLSLDVTSYIDLVSTDSLGGVIPTAYTENGLNVVFDWAPEQLKRMVNHYGMRFGIVDGLVRWTPTGYPDAWPDVFYAAFPSRPVALASFKTMLMVLCEDGLFGLAGNTPSTLSVLGPFSNLGCIAPFSVQSSNYGVMWLSKNGVCISPDGVSARCLTADRVAGRYFYAPSEEVIVDGINIGGQWWMPSTQSTQFAESMREEKIHHSLFPVTEVTADLPINAEMSDIRSFYWNDRYALYATGNTEHARMGIITIDMTPPHVYMQAPPLAMTTIPMKPTDVHVSLGGDCYMLLDRGNVPMSLSVEVGSIGESGFVAGTNYTPSGVNDVLLTFSVDALYYSSPFTITIDWGDGTTHDEHIGVIHPNGRHYSHTWLGGGFLATVTVTATLQATLESVTSSTTFYASGDILETQDPVPTGRIIARGPAVNATPRTPAPGDTFRSDLVFNTSNIGGGYIPQTIANIVGTLLYGDTTAPYVQIDMLTPTKVTHYMLDSSGTGKSVTDWEMLGSNDGLSFAALHQITNSDSNLSFISLSAPVTYRYYRFRFLKTTANPVTFNAIQLYRLAP